MSSNLNLRDILRVFLLFVFYFDSNHEKHDFPNASLSQPQIIARYYESKVGLYNELDELILRFSLSN